MPECDTCARLLARILERFQKTGPMMLFKYCQIITPTGLADADLRTVGEIITQVEADLAPTNGEEVINATGRWLLPGAVDGHTHFGMPLGSELSSLGWADSSAAALLGGTTTVIDFANPTEHESLSSAVARWRDLADGHTLCDYGLHVTVPETTPDRLAEIPSLIAAGLPTFKGFLAYKGRLMLRSDQMRTLMVAVHAHGGMLLVHAEDGEMNAAAEQVLQDTGRTAPVWHPLAHPPESETRAVREVLDLARTTGCPLAIVHLSLAESVDILKQTRAQRGPDHTGALIGEVCLHHLFADESLYGAGHEAALGAICSPPLRPPENGPELLTALATGDLDFLSTDHCEFRLRDKSAAAAGGFTKVPNGCGGVGERLVMSYTRAVVTGAMSPQRWQDVLCARPAELLGLAGRKGRLAPGCDADIVLFDPEPEYRWKPLGASDRAGSIWAGTPVRGRVTDVWLRGTRVVAGGRLAPDQAGGVFVPRRL